jgi:hypothetical protein
LHFFSSSLQGTFDAAGMDREIELRSKQLRERGGSEHRVTELVLEKEVDDGVGQFVGVSGSRALRNQARQTSAVVEGLGLVEHGTRKPERPDGFDDG